MTAERSVLHASALRLWQQRQAPQWIPMQGYSMLPLLRPGDQLQVTPPQPTYHRGQIIVLRHAASVGETLVVHRVVARRRAADRWCWITQGDNSRDADAAVLAQQIEGRVIALRRGDHCYTLETLPWRLGGRLVALAATSKWGRRLRRQWLRLLAWQLRKT
jgi:hypothetical protein